MAKLAVLDKTGKKVSDIELKDEIFAIEPNKSAMHLVVVNYLANQRQGTQSTLTRSEVSGGGKKPGSRRAPAAHAPATRAARCGPTAASRLRRSRATTATRSTRRSRDWPSRAH